MSNFDPVPAGSIDPADIAFSMQRLAVRWDTLQKYCENRLPEKNRRDVENAISLNLEEWPRLMVKFQNYPELVALMQRELDRIKEILRGNLGPFTW